MTDPAHARPAALQRLLGNGAVNRMTAWRKPLDH
jgi:hypothetical protein